MRETAPFTAGVGERMKTLKKEKRSGNTLFLFLFSQLCMYFVDSLPPRLPDAIDQGIMIERTPGKQVHPSFTCLLPSS